MSSPIENLYQLSKKNSLIVTGILSGTSADGIDVAVVRFSGDISNLDSPEVLAGGTVSYRTQTAKMLEDVKSLSVEEVSVLNRLIAEDFAVAVKEIESTFCVKSELIASHGQTVFHHSSGVSTLSESIPSTLQLGSGSIIAAHTGTPVVYDFRAKDIAFDGQGAPLTPATDYYLYRKKQFANHESASGRIDGILNLGGISNLTVFGSTITQTKGFDTGPANAPLDRLVKIYTKGQKKFDEDGQIALSGSVDENIVKALISSDVFVQMVPPKSAGIENYGDAFVKMLIQKYGKGVVTADLIATAGAFVAESVSFSLQKFVTNKVESLAVAGGGAYNPFLMQQLKTRLKNIVVETSDAVGIRADLREAIAFALMGYAHVRGYRFNLSSITGSTAPIRLGAIALP